MMYTNFREYNYIILEFHNLNTLFRNDAIFVPSVEWSGWIMAEIL